MIDTVDDLISELEKIPGDTKVRNVFDACGNYYYPRPKLKKGVFYSDNTEAIILSMEQEPMSETKDTILSEDDLINMGSKPQKASYPDTSPPPAPEVQQRANDMLKMIQQQYDNGNEEVKAALEKVVSSFEILVNVLVFGEEEPEPELLPEITCEVDSQYADDDDDEVASWFVPKKYG